MRALVWSGNLEIGTVDLRVWDEGMAVAGGVFLPNEDYNPLLHATELEGTKRSDRFDFTPLNLTGANGDRVADAIVSLVDWAGTAGEEHGREIVVFGLSELSAR